MIQETNPKGYLALLWLHPRSLQQRNIEWLPLRLPCFETGKLQHALQQSSMKYLHCAQKTASAEAPRSRSLSDVLDTTDFLHFSVLLYRHTRHTDVHFNAAINHVAERYDSDCAFHPFFAFRCLRLSIRQMRKLIDRKATEGACSKMGQST
jgi:hypothetical protein